MPGVFHAVNQLRFIQYGVGLSGGVAYLVSSYLHSDSPVKSEQLRIMAFGITAAVLPFIVLNVAPNAIVPNAISRDPIVPPEVTILSVILVPLCFAYAIMRYQLMGIRRLVHRGAAYALISIAVIMIYGALIAILRAAGGSDVSENTGVQILLLAVLFAAIPFMTGTRRLAFAAVDRLLYRDYIDHADLTRRASIGAASAGHMDQITTAVLGTIAEELRLSFAAFIGINNGTPSVKASVGNLSEEVTGTLSTAVGATREKPVSVSEMAIPSYPGQALLVQVRRDAQRAWALCLGPKVTEEAFRREDLDLAESVAGHVATMVEKLELLEELQTKTVELSELNRRLVQTQETERARIASYLHDEPLQQISDLIWQHAGSNLPPKVKGELRHITEGLRDFTTRLHPALLQDLGLVRALEWLGSETRTTSGFKLVFDPGSLGRNEKLDPDVELALYRITQEALTNCQRHAQATTVWVRLIRDEDQITLLVEDDGIGLPPAEEFEHRARLGLVGMRERAEQVGGDMRISSRDLSGTKVEASLPILQSTAPTEKRDNEVSTDD